jgi:steroid 5-alpha reductase family enzyme
VIINSFPVLAAHSPYQLSVKLLETAPLQTIAPILPALSLIALFISSTIFTESISLSKYPDGYRAYQKRVGMFLPLPWGWIVGRDKDVMLWGKPKGE